MMNIKYTSMTARFSKCHEYRYWLFRMWVNTINRDFHSKVTFIMLNPSTANDEVDDPTVRRCVQIANNNYCDRLEIVNLFDFISPDPKELIAAGHPVSVLNNYHIGEAVSGSQTVICAWGSLVKDEILRTRAREVLKLIHMPTFALHINKDGNPKHPLYCKSDSKLVAFDKDKY